MRKTKSLALWLPYEYQAYLINVITTRQRGWSDFAIDRIRAVFLDMVDRGANYYLTNSTGLFPPFAIPLPFVDFVETLGVARSGWVRDKRTVEIISGRDRRLQGQGEETGSRLQRDRSGVSEMEPLPATQDALRLELRPRRQKLGSTPPSLSLSLSSPFGFPLHGATWSDTVDPAIVFGLLADVGKAPKSTSTDLTLGESREKILPGTPSFQRTRRNDGWVSHSIDDTVKERGKTHTWRCKSVVMLRSWICKC